MLFRSVSQSRYTHKWNIESLYDDMIVVRHLTKTLKHVTLIHILIYKGTINARYPQAGVLYDKTFKYNSANILQITEEIITTAEQLPIMNI